MTRGVAGAVLVLLSALTGCAGHAAAGSAAVSPTPIPTVTVTAKPAPAPTVTVRATVTATPTATPPSQAVEGEVSLTQCGSMDDKFPVATVNFVNGTLDYHAYTATVEFRSIYGGPLLGRATVKTAPVPPGASDHPQAIDYDPAAQDAIPADTIRCRLVASAQR